MACGEDRTKSLKEALYESLTAILSPVHDVRLAGEAQIKALEVTEEFGVHLAEFTVDVHGSLAHRQLSSVLLKQYVEAHWSQHSEKFREPETSQNAKEMIRQVLPVGLKETISKVRSSVAYAVSAIAHWDWPEAWPNLFDILVQALTSEDANAVHGAMRVLTEFTREVTDTQMPEVASVILPEMYKIFTQASVYSVRTRSRAVDIFNTCTSMILEISQYHKGVAKQILFPTLLPQFVEAFTQALQVPDGLVSDSGLKMEVLKALTTLLKNMPGKLSQWLPQILPPVWTALTESVVRYVRTVVNDHDLADDPVDSDGEVLGFENLVFSIFEFIHGLIETPKFHSTVKSSMDQLIYYVVLYMQITEDQISNWSNNPDQFVEDEDDDTFSYSVRISAQDLLLSLASEFIDESAPSLVQCVTRHLQEAEEAKNSGNEQWWKIHEAVMLTVGSIKTIFIEACKERKVEFDINGFLQRVVLEDLNKPVSPFLLGRCLWTASRFASVMSPELIQSFLQATVSGLLPQQPPSVRISAVRAVFGFCEHLKSSNATHLLLPVLPAIFEGLLTTAQQFSSEVLALCLETLVVVLSIDSSFTASVEERVTPLSIAFFLKFSGVSSHDVDHKGDKSIALGNPLIVSLCQDIFKELSLVEVCRQPVQQRLLPTLNSILQAPADKVPMGLPSTALDILETLVRSSGVPLSDALIQMFPVAARCIMTTDDNSTMQSGGECIRAYVSQSVDQVAQWKDEHDNNGLSYVVQVVSRLLDPRTSEYTACFVGRLVSILISKLGDALGEHLSLMLNAVLIKMQKAETLSVIQNLVMVFAHLVHSQLHAVLDFLTNVPGPTAKPALEFVLSEWCSRQHLFYGAYEGKVSAVALVKLLEHAMNTNDERLWETKIKGEQIYDQGAGIRTRSKADKAPDKWTMVPIVVKIYKLLINELSNQLESQNAGGGDDDEEVEEEWEDADDLDEDGRTDGQTLQDLLMSGAGNLGYDLDTIDDTEDDPDAVNDPINNINLQAFLLEFLKWLSEQPRYPELREHHNEAEKTVLRTIGINV